MKRTRNTTQIAYHKQQQKCIDYIIYETNNNLGIFILKINRKITVVFLFLSLRLLLQQRSINFWTSVVPNMNLTSSFQRICAHPRFSLLYWRSPFPQPSIPSFILRSRFPIWYLNLRNFQLHPLFLDHTFPSKVSTSTTFNSSLNFSILLSHPNFPLLQP